MTLPSNNASSQPRLGLIEAAAVCMAKAKKIKPNEHLVRWRVSLITSTPVKFGDYTLAPDAETAEKQVAEAHRISDRLRDRLVAVKDET